MKKVLFISAIFLTCGFANATIIVTTVGSTFINTDYNLDLNNDAITDFIIKSNGPSWVGGVTTETLNSNTVQTTSGNAAAFSSGASIGSLTWSIAFAIPLDNFYGQGLRYLGLKIVVGSNTYYGWAEIDVPTDGDMFSLYRYAFENIPNGSISAGQTVGIFENGHNENIFNLFPNPSSDYISIELQNSIKSNSAFRILNSIGQEIKSETINSSITKINIYDLPKGIYIVAIIEDNRIYYKKFTKL